MDKRKYVTETGAIETHEYDPTTGDMHVKKTYDVQEVLDDNLRARNDAPEFGRYDGGKTGLVHAARVSQDDISRLNMLGYNLLSHDPDEAKRALLYLQSEEKYHLRLPGKPFAKKKLIWQ